MTDIQISNDGQPDTEHQLLQESSMSNKQTPSSESKPLICPKHRLPIRGVCLHPNCPQKIICGKCFKELPEEFVKSYEDTDDFLSSNRLAAFSEDIASLEREAQKNLNILKSSIGTVDATFERFIEHVNSIKNKIREQMARKFDRDHESLQKLTGVHSSYRSLMKELLKQQSGEKLSECAEAFSELTELVRMQPKFDRTKFTAYASEMNKRWTLQFEFCKNILDKTLNTSEPPIGASVHVPQVDSSSRFRSVSPFKKKTSLPKLNASPGMPLHRQIVAQAMKTTEREYKNATTTRLTDLTKSYGLSLETMDTKMKTIDAMTYLPTLDAVVLGGMVKGDQFHKLVFQKLSPAPVVTKILNAHANTINNVLGSEHYLFSCSKDKMIKIWELSSYDCLMVLKHESSVSGMLYDDLSGTLYSYGTFLDMRVWNLPKKKEIAPLKVPTSQVSQACFVGSNKEDGRKWIAVGCELTGKVYLMDIKSGYPILEFESHASVGYMSLVHYSDSNLLVGSSVDGLVKIWDLNKVQPPFLSRVMYFNSRSGTSVITSVTNGMSDGLVFLANSTNVIMVGTATETRLQGLVKFDEENIFQHSKLLYIDQKGILISINKFNGRLVLINVSSLRGYTSKVQTSRSNYIPNNDQEPTHNYLNESRFNSMNYFEQLSPQFQPQGDQSHGQSQDHGKITKIETIMPKNTTSHEQVKDGNARNDPGDQHPYDEANKNMGLEGEHGVETQQHQGDDQRDHQSEK